MIGLRIGQRVRLRPGFQSARTCQVGTIVDITHPAAETDNLASYKILFDSNTNGWCSESHYSFHNVEPLQVTKIVGNELHLVSDSQPEEV